MSMVDAVQVPVELVPDTLQPGGGTERLPLPQAAALILVMSLSVWGAIGLGVGWLVS